MSRFSNSQIRRCNHSVLYRHLPAVVRSHSSPSDYSLISLLRLSFITLLLGLVTNVLPVALSTALVSNSRIYPLMEPLFARLPPLDVSALGRWFRSLLPGIR